MYQVSFIRLLKTTSSSLNKNIVVIYDQLEKKMKLEKNNIDQKGEELDKEKIERFIYIEYTKFIMKSVNHFRFNENAT